MSQGDLICDITFHVTFHWLLLFVGKVAQKPCFLTHKMCHKSGIKSAADMKNGFSSQSTQEKCYDTPKPVNFSMRMFVSKLGFCLGRHFNGDNWAFLGPFTKIALTHRYGEPCRTTCPYIVPISNVKAFPRTKREVEGFLVFGGMFSTYTQSYSSMCKDSRAQVKAKNIFRSGYSLALRRWHCRQSSMALQRDIEKAMGLYNFEKLKTLDLGLFVTGQISASQSCF